MTTKQHSTNYYNTFIEVAPDTKATTAEQPKSRGANKTLAEIQYELLQGHPYQFTSDEVAFQAFAIKKELAEEEQPAARFLFFSKGQPCLRTSPLAKRYGFGFHCNHTGHIALVGMDTEAYQEFLSDPAVKKVPAMRSSAK